MFPFMHPRPADYAAWNVWSSMCGRVPLPFRYQHLGDMMVLGRAAAAVALPVGDVTLDGVPAAALRRLAYLYRMPTNEHRLAVGVHWISKAASAAATDPSRFLLDLGLPVPPGVFPPSSAPAQ